MFSTKWIFVCTYITYQPTSWSPLSSLASYSHHPHGHLVRGNLNLNNISKGTWGTLCTLCLFQSLPSFKYPFTFQFRINSPSWEDAISSSKLSVSKQSWGLPMILKISHKVILGFNTPKNFWTKRTKINSEMEFPSEICFDCQIFRLFSYFATCCCYNNLFKEIGPVSCCRASKKGWNKITQLL